VITPRVEEQLERDFAGRREARALVERIPAQLSMWKIVSNNDEVEVAALHMAGGDIERLRHAVELALHDWRDLLVAVRGG
jgi:hypothetical protein